MKEKIIQCLFDYKIFFSKSGHLYFPATLSFPQYFAFAISSIFYNIFFAFKTNNQHLMNVCYYYFEILPVIIEQIYGKNYKIEIDITKLEEISNRLKEEEKDSQTNNTIDNVLLETYLKNEESVINYRKALLENSLEYYGCNNINELVNHLCNVKCCDKTKVKDIQEYPSSDHYLLIGDGNNVNKNILLKKGTSFWGPFYWNVFHTVAETACENDDKLVNFIYVLPFTLPCDICTNNYMKKMPYFQTLIDEYQNSKVKCLKNLYNKIHDKISYETKFIY